MKKNCRKIISLFLISFALKSALFAYTDYYGFELTPEEEEALAIQAAASADADEEDATIFSSSFIDWSKGTFDSDVFLDILKAKIPMPSGKTSSVNKIQMQLPILIKDPLLSIYVDDEKTLGDLVLSQTITLEELTHIITEGKQTPAVFTDGSNTLKTKHSIKIQDIGKVLVKHKNPYALKQPIERTATRAYTGIIIDARGSLETHGEFVKSEAEPCIFPKIYDEEMTLLYEKNMVLPDIAKEKGIVLYGSSQDLSDYKNRVGNDPLWIQAKEIFGINRSSPVISHEDFLKIACLKQNLDLLKEGKVVIILDKDKLSHPVSAPLKNKKYYLAYEKIRQFIYDSKLPDTFVIDDDNGIKISMENLRFQPDSANLLPEERGRVTEIAESMKRYIKSGDFTILVEGHTADVNKPNGQLILSIQRAQAIIDLLVEDGLNRSLFTFKGYGGTKPKASNETEEGRAQNRRVEITLMPKGSTIQRQ